MKARCNATVGHVILLPCCQQLRTSRAVKVSCCQPAARMNLAHVGTGVIALCILFTTAAAEVQHVKVGLEKQLFIDDLVIETNTGLRRELGKVTKANQGNPLVFTRKTAGDVSVPIDVWPLFASVYFDADRQKFRMWHRISFDDLSRRKVKDVTVTEIGVGSDYHRAYSESDDGIHFQLVSLLEGLTTSGDTNLVVTIDEHEIDPQHRYKIGYDCEGKVHAAALAHSADGIHWMPYNGGNPVTYRAADFTNQIYFDPKVQAYRLLTRTDFGWGGGPLAGSVDVDVDGHRLEVRGVRSMTNPDVKRNPTNWTVEQHWFLDGEEQWSKDRPPIEELLKNPHYLKQAREQALRRQVYIMTHWIYEGVYFGLLSVLEWPTDVSEGVETDRFTRHERSVVNFYIATSRDGIGWNLHWVYAGQPFVPRGPNGAWDKDMVFPTSQIITHEDKHWIYYGGTNERHGAAEKNVWFDRDGSLGLALLRLDGFVALCAGEEQGSITTKPFLLEGENLELNVDARGEGKVRVELLSGSGEPIAGFSGVDAGWIDGVDEVRFRPHWASQANLATLKGETVRLRIHLKNAKLYAFQVRP